MIIENIEYDNIKIPETIIEWIKEDDLKDGNLITYKDFKNISLNYWIKYVLQDEESFNYHPVNPFKIKRDKFNELIKYISNIELNENEFILVCSETEDSEEVYIFQTNEDSINNILNGKYGNTYKNNILKLLSMNVVGFYSKENGIKYNSYNNKNIDTEKESISKKIDNLM